MIMDIDGLPCHNPVVALRNCTFMYCTAIEELAKVMILGDTRRILVQCSNRPAAKV